METKLIDTIVEKVSESNVKTLNQYMEEKILPAVGEQSAKTARAIVDTMLAEKYVRGFDTTGLSDEKKLEFAKQVKAAIHGNREKATIINKANEGLIEEQDNRGGYLVEPEVAAAILRIAASVGTIMKQCQRWPMKTDELGIPNYTGSFLTGSYVGVDLPGTVTGLTFGQAVLVAKKWQLAFTVGNDLMADTNVSLADWLLAMAGEALANVIDQQGFAGGTGNVANSVTVAGPFQGILSVPGTNTYYSGASSTSGKVHISDYNVVTDSGNVVAQLEESVLDGAAWYFHRTSWAAFRTQLASTSGIPYLFLSGAGGELSDTPAGGPIKPAGSLMGYPVYTNRWLPLYATTSQPSTVFGIFGNMKACAFGDKGDMRVGNFQSGSFGGKEIALSDQTGIVYKHRHAFVVVLPKAFVLLSTSAS